MIDAVAIWEIVFSAREYEPGEGRDSEVGWAYDVEREGVQRTIGVEVSRALAEADKQQLPTHIRAALRTRGRSAVMPVLGRETIPRRLVLEPDGIVEIDR